MKVLLLMAFLLVGCSSTELVRQTTVTQDTLITVSWGGTTTLLPIVVDLDSLLVAQDAPLGKQPKNKVSVHKKDGTVTIEQARDSVQIPVTTHKEETTLQKQDGFFDRIEKFLGQFLVILCVVAGVGLLISFLRK